MKIQAVQFLESILEGKCEHCLVLRCGLYQISSNRSSKMSWLLCASESRMYTLHDQVVGCSGLPGTRRGGWKVVWSVLRVSEASGCGLLQMVCVW